MAASDSLGELVAKLAEIAPLASQVAELKGQTVQQEAEALAAILERIKPILPVVVYRIKSHGSHSGHQFHKWEYDYEHYRGLVLIDNTEKKLEDGDTRGCYRGKDLALTADGVLIERTMNGDWSHWQGESSYFTYEGEEIGSEDAVNRYGLKAIVGGLASELAEASEGLKKKQSGYEERLGLVQKVREILQ
jgi:hypothetical protein